MHKDENLVRWAGGKKKKKKYIYLRTIKIT